MKSKHYGWANYVPLTCRDAREAIKKGVQVFLLCPDGKTARVTSESDVKRYARKGRTFGADREELEKAVTVYSMDYRIIHPISGPAIEMKTPATGLVLTVEANNHYALFENGGANFTKLAKQHSCPDGEYWVEYHEYRKGLCEEKCFSFDEGVMTIKNGEAIRFPDNFWLPF